MPTAAEEGFAMPPEWSAQEAIWISWPVDDPRHWGGQKREIILDRFVVLAAAISRFEIVRINAIPGTEDEIRERCLRAKAVPERLEIFPHLHNDVWCRDHGPIFLKHRESGNLAISDWEFNAWGGKFAPWDADNSIPSQISQQLRLPSYTGGMILEGGAIEINGCDQLLTTEAVLLNPNRNPHLNREQIEQKLCQTLGVKEVLWLEKGIEGDDTDGHIDDLARFCADDLIAVCVDRDPSSPNHRVLDANLHRLREFRTPSGRPFELVEIPMPAACEVPGWRLPILPASYVNFLIVNGGLLVPTFRQGRNDDRALGTLRELFPDREVVGIDCLDLVEEGGTLHCLTQQQPA
ncbi:agmatine deiminase [Haloferula luteola]|uniref:Agmatine deiminase n=1 Tax=Haloferula luteola TaxID=595692 RepID=A0A840V8F5_9BACT|nr:agmatine deiminase family protein [Haloferula luteola]MBB5351018.1 agmatine deiminase [Haloferula luteola]